MTQYETKDSGAREHFESGMQRDTEEGKARFDLMIPEGVPYEDQLLTRFANLLARGAVKYDARNWEQATGEAEIARAKSSAFRHFMQWFCGEGDEDHAVATMFNIMVVETTAYKRYRAEDQEFVDRLEGLMAEKLNPETGTTSEFPSGTGDLSEDEDELAEKLKADDVPQEFHFPGDIFINLPDPQDVQRQISESLGRFLEKMPRPQAHFKVGEDGEVTQNVPTEDLRFD